MTARKYALIALAAFGLFPFTAVHPLGIIAFAALAWLFRWAVRRRVDTTGQRRSGDIAFALWLSAGLMIHLVAIDVYLDIPGALYRLLTIGWLFSTSVAAVFAISLIGGWNYPGPPGAPRA